MDILIMRVLMDCSFYLVLFAPLVHGGSTVICGLLMTVLAGWVCYLLMGWRRGRLIGGAQDAVFFEGKLLALIQLFELVIWGLAKWQTRNAPYVVAFIVFAVLLLRASRIERTTQGRHGFWGISGVEFAVILGLVFLVASKTVRQMLVGGLGDFYMTFILPILFGVIRVIQVILYLIWPLLMKIFKKVEFQEEYMNVDTSTVADVLRENDFTTNEVAWYWKYVGIALVVAMVAAFLWYLYRRLSQLPSAKKQETAGEINRSGYRVIERKKSPNRFWNGEKNVRYYYRKFLDLCRSNGIDTDAGMVTTKDVYEMAADQWREEDVYLRDLRTMYLDVRYGGKDDREEERKLAKVLYKKIKDAAEKLQK